jgi:hypothetical protein
MPVITPLPSLYTISSLLSNRRKMRGWRQLCWWRLNHLYFIELYEIIYLDLCDVINDFMCVWHVHMCEVMEGNSNSLFRCVSLGGLRKTEKKFHHNASTTAEILTGYLLYESAMLPFEITCSVHARSDTFTCLCVCTCLVTLLSDHIKTEEHPIIIKLS